MAVLPPGGPAGFPYLHVPFCDTLCRFCGCNTAVLRNADARAAYAALLHEELRRVIALIGPGRRVTHLQWGRHAHHTARECNAPRDAGHTP